MLLLRKPKPSAPLLLLGDRVFHQKYGVLTLDGVIHYIGCDTAVCLDQRKERYWCPLSTLSPAPPAIRVLRRKIP